MCILDKRDFGVRVFRILFYLVLKIGVIVLIFIRINRYNDLEKFRKLVVGSIGVYGDLC